MIYDLKLTKVTPEYKKESKYNKSNYRPNKWIAKRKLRFSKMSYTIIYYCIKCYHSIKQVFENVLMHWAVYSNDKKNQKTIRWESKICSSAYCDLSQIFDCLPRDLITTKLQIYAKLLKWKVLRVKIHNSYSDWRLIKYGVLQGWILGPIL